MREAEIRRIEETRGHASGGEDRLALQSPDRQEIVGPHRFRQGLEGVGDDAEKNQQVQKAANGPLTPTLSRRERAEDFPSPPAWGRGQGEGGSSTGECQKRRAQDQKP